jgi:hypothetical protein
MIARAFSTAMRKSSASKRKSRDMPVKGLAIFMLLLTLCRF